jgi:aldehyde dehydrogenase
MLTDRRAWSMLPVTTPEQAHFRRKPMTKVEFNRTSKPPFKARYGNYIGGAWREPVSGKYFDNTSPINGQVICEIARSEAADVELALEAAPAPATAPTC